MNLNNPREFAIESFASFGLSTVAMCAAGIGMLVAYNLGFPDPGYQFAVVSMGVSSVFLTLMIGSTLLVSSSDFVDDFVSVVLPPIFASQLVFGPFVASGDIQVHVGPYVPTGLGALPVLVGLLAIPTLLSRSVIRAYGWSA